MANQAPPFAIVEGKRWSDGYTSDVSKMSLYHYPSCYFCRIVRQVMEQHDFDIELRDIHQNRNWQDELIAARGRRTVPVLRIEHEDGSVEWMPESRDIARYLRGLAAAS